MGSIHFAQLEAKSSISSRLKDQGCAVMGEKEPYPQRLETVRVVIINTINRVFIIINLLDFVSSKFTMEKIHWVYLYHISAKTLD